MRADVQTRVIGCASACLRAARLMSGATRTAMIKSTIEHETKVDGAQVCAPLRKMGGAQLCAVRAPKLTLLYAAADRCA